MLVEVVVVLGSDIETNARAVEGGAALRQAYSVGCAAVIGPGKVISKWQDNIQHWAMRIVDLYLRLAAVDHYKRNEFNTRKKTYRSSSNISC